LRYEDETHLTPIRDALAGSTALVEGTVLTTEVMYRPRRQLVCQIEDASGILYMRFLNFYGSQVKQLSEGARVRILGEVRQGFFGAEMVHPKYRTIKDDAPLSESLTPVYPTVAGLQQPTLRKWVAEAMRVTELTDTLPDALLKKLRLAQLKPSLTILHFPTPDIAQQQLQERTHPAWQRLKFDELLAQQLSMRKHYRERRERKAPVLRTKNSLTKKLLTALPFPLTGAQKKVMGEISADLTQGHPMQRLLQGDVGSGKTIVAAFAALQAIENGYQAALMAPTEILTEQHYRKLSALLEPLGVNVVWLTGSMKAKEKLQYKQIVTDGTAQLVIGTHALFQEDVSFKKLGLAIIDEQHRFGVAQRLALRMKGASVGEPHQLMMSATPIPRTLSMSYYADLDVSVIDELPPGRTPIATRLISDERRDEVIDRVRKACEKGAQAYWVCPLIEESEKLQLQTAIETYENIQATFPDLKVGLVHGRLKPAEKAAVMKMFQQNEIQLLVATTVIEVGVDVPNASLMVIDHAERMGLSQLHQLRGRVGRGAEKSSCILLYQTPLSEQARERLKVIYENTDGFMIAEADLRLRGPGEFLGSRQSGAAMLRFADLDLDADLLEAAQKTAEDLLQHQPEVAELHLKRWLSSREDYLKV
jgi:ATP-dependent DNA helicase RecG